MADPSAHEKRSQELADAMRRFLVGVHTGGIGLAFLATNALADAGVRHCWCLFPVLPVLLFLFGLVVTGASLMFAKDRELDRRDAARDGESQPDFSASLKRSFLWESISLALFLSGSIAGLVTLALIASASDANG